MHVAIFMLTVLLNMKQDMWK